MPIQLPVQSLQPLSTSGTSASANAAQADISAELAAGRTLEANVRDVAQDPQRPNFFRIKVEVQRQLMELLTSKPLQTGTQISLSQDAGGRLQLTLANPPQTRSQATTTAESQSTTLQLRPLSAAQSADVLNRLLPIDQPRTARVIQNTPAPAAASGSTQDRLPSSQPQSSQPQSSSPQKAGQSSVPATAGDTTPGNRGNQPNVQAQTGSVRPSQPEPGAASRQTPTPTQPPPETSNRGGQTQAPASTPGNTTDRPLPAAQQPAPAARGNRAAVTAQPAPGPAPQTSRDTPPPAQGAQTPAPAQPANAPPATAATGNVQGSLSTPAARGERAAANPQPAPGPAPQTSRDIPPVARGAQITTPAQAASTAPASAAAGNVQVSLALSGQRIDLLSPRPLQPGLQVQLTRSGDNQIQLQLATPRHDSGAQLKLQEGLQQILRDNLPHQLPAGDALNQLRQIPVASRQSGDAIAQVVKSMLSLFSVPVRGDAKTTQQAVQNHLRSSGLITQPQQQHGGSPRELPPLQQQLGKLSQLAERLPPQAREQMLTLVKGLQARSASHQATSLQNWQELPDGSIERQYRLDLPIRLAGDRLEDSEIRIQQHKERDDEGRFVSQWSIQLHFDREQLGSVDVHVSLQREWQLSARFWAERDETSQLIRAQLGDFEQQLNASGFEVDSIQVQRGRPPRDNRPVINHRLVDLHT
ncbi:flagellar hook-length control protein FliK [Marinobacterium sp. YM272]|uniref:flagellar hook-length control protein FliK n=1 Tax=Marinobacterium sp. YM272 TaxID=3421654 RepID=UPI003D7F7A21